jgi:hypothetical protein
MADHVDRLRYLRSSITVGPRKPWRRATAARVALAAILAAAVFAMIVAALIVALVLWNKS